MCLELKPVCEAIADACVHCDQTATPFKTFQAGVGPYGEPQLLKMIAEYLTASPHFKASAVTKRTPDLLMPGHWAIEAKIARPFGDNGQEAENWSVNLLHPYPGNVSAFGDVLKLQALDGAERRAVLVFGYEHVHPVIDLEALFSAFEVLVEALLPGAIGPRVEVVRFPLIHPVHARLRIVAWEVYRNL